MINQQQNFIGQQKSHTQNYEPIKEWQIVKENLAKSNWKNLDNS